MENLKEEQKALALKVANYHLKDLEKEEMEVVAGDLGCSVEDLQGLKAALEAEEKKKEEAPAEEKKTEEKKEET